MKNIKPIVQVMNLFSLVRINSAKSKVEEFGMTSSVLTRIISSIMYNDNIVLDKNSVTPDPTKPVLNVYIASDYGFCSSYNQVVSQKIKDTKDDYKIIIGRKIAYNDDKVLVKVAKDDFYREIGMLKDLLTKAVNERSYSKIIIYYNHYYNFSKSEFTSLQVFPVLYDEKYKIRMGCWYLKYLSDMFDGNRDLIVAAYNAGPTNVQNWLNDKQYSKDGKTLDYIPFGETKKYVDKVNTYYNVYEYLYGENQKYFDTKKILELIQSILNVHFLNLF